MRTAWKVAPVFLQGILALAQPVRPPVSIEDTLKGLESAYLARSLGTYRLGVAGPVTVSIRHASKEGPAGTERRTFRSLKALEQWLRSREVGGAGPGEDRLPRREVRPRTGAGPGYAEYDIQGISHNTLVLAKVRFDATPRGWRILAIELYCGD